jgi:hypothetical protein
MTLHIGGSDLIHCDGESKRKTQQVRELRKKEAGSEI